MPSNTTLLIFNTCHPEVREQGKYLAAEACPLKAVKLVRL